MSTHLPVNPSDPNRGGIPFDGSASPEDVLAVLNALRPEPSGDVVVTDLGDGIVDIVGRGHHLVMPRGLMEFLQSDRGRELLHIPARHGKSPWAGIVVDDPLSPVDHSPELIRLKLKELCPHAFTPQYLPHTPAPEPAEPLLMPALTIPTRVHRDDHPSTRETWQGQHEHHRHHDLMVAEHATTGIYRDPVSGRTFPPGQTMKRDPNRAERRRLAAWRASGKVRRCP